MANASTLKAANRGLGGRLTRRQLLGRAAGLGIGLPAIATLLAACGGDDPSTPVSPTQEVRTPSTPPSEAITSGGTLIEGTFADATTVNPVMLSDTASATVVNLMFNTLVALDPDTVAPRGELAESWSVSPDSLEYTFRLRDGVTWHDGTPLTARDVKFTYDLHLNPDAPSVRTGELGAHIKSVAVDDDRTVKFTLNDVVASFLVTDMVHHIVPEHILSDVAAAELAGHPFSTGQKGVTIGTGPFMFEEWVKDDHMTLVKFNDYWAGEPKLDRYIFRVVADGAVLTQFLKSGDIHYSGRDGVEESFYQDLSSAKDLNVVSYDTFDFTYYAYQLDPAKTSLFQQKEVRQALLYALDRKTMIETIRFGLGEVAVGTMGPISWASDPAAIKNSYPFDREKAKQLLDQAGWRPGGDGIRVRDGKRFSFKLYLPAGSSINDQYAAVMQQSWKEIGVECQLHSEEWGAFISRISETKDFEAFLVGFSWDPDPDQSSMWATEAYNGGFNVNKYSNPTVDQLLQQALATTDQSQRKQLYTQMQNVLLDELPSAILDFPKAYAAFSKRVHNLVPNVVDDRHNAHEWWLE